MAPIVEGGYPLPDDPDLAEMASALSDAGHWAEIVDSEWRTVFVTEGLRFAGGFMIEPLPVKLGTFAFGAEAVELHLASPTASVAVDNARQLLAGFGAWVIEDLPGGRDELRRLVDPRLTDIVDQLGTTDRSSTYSIEYDGHGVKDARPRMDLTAVRVRDRSGRLAGTALIHKPHIDMSVLASLTAMGDLGHLQRMQSVARAARRPGAILFADLEGSSSLSKSLSTANYFALGRRMTRAADQCIVDAGGITGRHSGDGVIAFFLAEHLGSELAAASACIGAARALRVAMVDVASRSNLAPEQLTMRFGLHWGAALYVGQISTVGRTETTALGDEVNEAARIEACATGGGMLASKHLIEHLDPAAAHALGVDLDRVTYTQLGELTGATEKARRDAPSIAVCDL